MLIRRPLGDMVVIWKVWSPNTCYGITSWAFLFLLKCFHVNSTEQIETKSHLIQTWHWAMWQHGVTLPQACSLYYYSDLTLSQSFQPMTAQLSMEAVLPLAKSLATVFYRSDNRGPWSHIACDILATVIMMTSSNGNIFRATGPLCGGFTGYRWIPVNSPYKIPLTRSFDVFFDLRLNKRLSKQSWGWWFETPSCPLWRHCKDAGDLGDVLSQGGCKGWHREDLATRKCCFQVPAPWIYGN